MGRHPILTLQKFEFSTARSVVYQCMLSLHSIFWPPSVIARSKILKFISFADGIQLNLIAKLRRLHCGRGGSRGHAQIRTSQKPRCTLFLAAFRSSAKGVKMSPSPENAPRARAESNFLTPLDVAPPDSSTRCEKRSQTELVRGFSNSNEIHYEQTVLVFHVRHQVAVSLNDVN